MATPFLCDTNIISELMRPQPQPEVRRWLEAQEIILLSVLSLEELHYGLQRKNLHQKRDWLDRFVAARCECLPIDARIAIRAGEMRGELAKQGQTRTQADLLIAATAITHQTILATRNTRDFENLNLPLFNPFILHPS
jgi:toxin FitB